MPDIHKVEISWMHDDLGIKLTEIAVIARDRNKRIWAYELPPAASPGAEIIPLPAPHGGAAAEAPPVVVPRRRKDGAAKGE